MENRKAVPNDVENNTSEANMKEDSKETVENTSSNNAESNDEFNLLRDFFGESSSSSNSESEEDNSEIELFLQIMLIDQINTDLEIMQKHKELHEMELNQNPELNDVSMQEHIQGIDNEIQAAKKLQSTVASKMMSSMFGSRNVLFVSVSRTNNENSNAASANESKDNNPDENSEPSNNFRM